MTGKNDKFLAHCSMDTSKNIVEQQDIIIKELCATYNLSIGDVVEIAPLSENVSFSIKPIRDKTVKIKRQFREMFIHSLNGVMCLTIDEMRNSPQAMGTNRDVIELLDENRSKIVDSFVDLIEPLRIIWNITKECQ